MCENRSRVAGVWCGYCYANLKSRSGFSGHLKAPRGGASSTRKVMSLVKPAVIGGVTQAPAASRESEFATLHPSLWEYLSCEQWADGSARVPASLLIFVEGGLLKACVNDRALERTGWATGPTLEAVLASLDAGIASDGIEWRRAKPKGRK